MAIDSAEKRRSVSGIAGVPLLAGVTPDASTDQEWRQEAGWGYPGILATIVAETPPDDDADVSVTAYVDCDGATVRPPRVTVLASMDSSRNSALGGPDRTPMDTFEARSARAGRGRRDGVFPRIHAYCNRAGETLAPRVVVLEWEPVPLDPRTRAADSVAGTDCDGATVLVPTSTAFFAADSLRNADLKQGTSGVQDAFETKHLAPSGTVAGDLARIVWMASGRAGECGCPRQLEIGFGLTGDTLARGRVF